MGRLSKGPILDPHVYSTPKLRVEKSPFEIAAKRLEIDENVNGAHLVRHFLAQNVCLEQSYNFRQSLK